MMISKSTTADLLKMFYKLEEFFSQQFKSSKRVFTNLEPRLSSRSSSSISRRQRKTTLTSENSFESREWGDAHHHRHWQKPLKKAMGLMLTTLSVPLPKTGIVLGGTIELHGTNISLACFHGINFKVNIPNDFESKSSSKTNCLIFSFSRLNHGHCSVYVILVLILPLKQNKLITQTMSLLFKRWRSDWALRTIRIKLIRWQQFVVWRVT